MLKNIWSSIFNSNVKSVLLYGSETWKRTEKALQKIQTFVNSYPRRIVNIWWPEKFRNEELWQRREQEPVGRQILRRKWGWICHTLRQKSTRQHRSPVPVREPGQGKRKRGRPRNSWRRDTNVELKLTEHSYFCPRRVLAQRPKPEEASL